MRSLASNTSKKGYNNMVNNNDQSQWYKTFSQSTSMYDMFQRSVQRYSDNSLFIIETPSRKINTVSFSECSKYVDNFAGRLMKDGIINKKAALIGEFSLEWFIAFFAVLKLFNTVVPMRSDIISEELHNNIDLTGIDCIICSDELEEMCKKECDNIYTFKSMLIPYETDVTEKPDISYNDNAMIVLTSGTTEQSKAVLLTHKNLISGTLHTVNVFGKDSFTTDDRLLSFLPPHHMFQIMAGMIIELYYGISICISFNKLNAFTTFEPSIFIAVPEIIEGLHKKVMHLINDKNELLSKLISNRKSQRKKTEKVFGSKLKAILSGGAATNNELLDSFDKLGIKILTAYGMTECSPLISASTFEANKYGAVGRVNTTPYCQVKIKNEEILVRGDIVFNGYYNNDKAECEAFDGDWFRTGDMGYIDDDGYLFITGRLKNLIILSDGNNISPEYIESVLIEQKEVDDALVYAQKNNKAVMLNADVILSDNIGDYDKNAVSEQLMKYINAKLPAYSHLSKINIVTEQFRRNSLGKKVRYQMAGGVQQ